MRRLGPAEPRLMHIHYEPTGTGREAYILGNNGGFTVGRSILSGNVGKNMFPPPIKYGRAYAHPGPTRIESKALNYLADGSGRDSYIAENAGGFQVSGAVIRKMGRASAFEHNLRGYSRIDRGPSPLALLDELKNQDIEPFDKIKDQDKRPLDYLRCSNNFVNNKQALRENLRRCFKQTLTSSRLSKPKLPKVKSPDWR